MSGLGTLTLLIRAAEQMERAGLPTASCWRTPATKAPLFFVAGNLRPTSPAPTGIDNLRGMRAGAAGYRRRGGAREACRWQNLPSNFGFIIARTSSSPPRSCVAGRPTSDCWSSAIGVAVAAV